MTSVRIYLAPAGIRSSALSPARSFFSILISRSSPSTTNWTNWRCTKQTEQIDYTFFEKLLFWAEVKFFANDNLGTALPNIAFRTKNSLQKDFELHNCVSDCLINLYLFYVSVCPSVCLSHLGLSKTGDVGDVVDWVLSKRRFSAGTTLSESQRLQDVIEALVFLQGL